MRPKGMLGCPDVVPFAYTLRRDGDEAVSGAVAACAYAGGLAIYCPGGGHRRTGSRFHAATNC
jgi:hypothetical protein